VDRTFCWTAVDLEMKLLGSNVTSLAIRPVLLGSGEHLLNGVDTHSLG